MESQLAFSTCLWPWLWLPVRFEFAVEIRLIRAGPLKTEFRSAVLPPETPGHRIQRGGSSASHERLAGLDRVDDFVDPQARRP